MAPPARIFEESVTPYEIAFGEPDTQDATAAKKFDFKKRWPIAAAAVALLAIAGAGIPAVRHFGGAGAAAPTAEGTLTVNTNPPGAKVFVDGVERGDDAAVASRSSRARTRSSCAATARRD